MNEIDLYSRLQNPIEAIDRIGDMFAKSGMFGVEKIEQGRVLALACIAERKSPIQILREYHIVEGKLADRADSMLAKFRAGGGKHRVIARTDTEAAVELEKDGQKLTFRFTWEEAQNEPFVWSNKKGPDGKDMPKKNWATPRGRMQMLWARVISDGVRTLAPEIVSGIYTREEIEDAVDLVAPPAEPLLPKQRKEAKPANVVDIPTEVKPQAPEPSPVPESEVKSEQAPSAAAPGEQKKFGPSDVRLGPNGRITAETQQALMDAIGEENAGPALEWLIAKKWITTNLSELNIERARRILDKPEVFVGYVKGGAK